MLEGVDRASYVQEAQTAIKAKFPLLERLCFSNNPSRIPFQAPFFIGLIAAILESADAPCCIVVPEERGIALAVGALVALTRLQLEVPEVLTSYAKMSFQPGDRVMVNPSGLVYEYGGLFCPGFFKLGVLGRNESRSLPISEVARLEKTIRQMPKGFLNSQLGTPQPTVLGRLVGIPGSVNRNLLRNTVAILGAKKPLREEAIAWTVGVIDSHAPLSDILQEVVPFGEISDEGATHFLDTYVVSGEPMIALASRPEELAAYASLAPPKTKAIIVNDVERMARNLQAYDSVVERQRVILIAKESLHEAISVLHDRGCVIWQLTPEELLVGGDIGSKGPFRTIIRKAVNMRDLVIVEEPCTDALLEEAGGEIVGAAGLVPRTNDNPAVRELLCTLFGILMSCAEFLGSDRSVFRNQFNVSLDQLVKLLSRSRAWLSPEVAERVALAISKLRHTAEALSEQTMTAKGIALLDSLTGAVSAEKSAVVTRSEAGSEEVRRWVGAMGGSVPVYRVNEVPGDAGFEQLIFVAWPSARRFDHSLRRYPAPRLVVLAYAFERYWVGEYEKTRAQTAIPGLTTRRKRIMLRLVSDVTQGDEADTVDAAIKPGLFELPAERFLVRRKSVSSSGPDTSGSDEMCEAYYVDFVGATFSYITEGHELPIVNDLIRESSANPAVHHRSIEELKVCDFVLFRESGDSDIIRFIAEDEMGPKEYSTLRATATRWRSALASIGRDPAVVWNKLAESGFCRQLPTLRNWLVNEHMIAPKNIEDIRAIALAAGDVDLLARLSDVQNAGEEIKSRHIRAGFRLTAMLREALPKRIAVPGDREIRLDLGVGGVWIAKVDEIDRSTTNCNRSLVNRLLWDSEAGHLREGSFNWAEVRQ